MDTENDGYAAIEGGQRALLPPGKYELAFEHYETAVMFGRSPKLVLWFRVITYGPHFETKVARFYNITKLIGKKGRYGRFKVGWSSDFLREYATLFGMPHRVDRIAMTPFERIIIEGKVRTVTKGSQQRDIPECLHYSVVKELCSIKK